MADLGHERTDAILKQLEKQIRMEYQQAYRETQQKLYDYLKETEAGRLKQWQKLQAGEITQTEYNDWVYRHTMVGERWEAMKNTLAADYHNANVIARNIANDKKADVFALNGNYATYAIEHSAKIDTAFTLYNHDTAELLLSGDREMFSYDTAKRLGLAAKKDITWNQQKIQSSVLQGILQGESPFEVSKRLQGVAQMNNAASIRYARTTITSAQNEGRYEAYHRAEKVGVNLVLEWEATLDSRTRHDHRMLHGQRRKVDEPFEVDGIRIYYPAQMEGNGASDIPQSMIQNCRCTILSWVEGFEGDTVKEAPGMGGLSFDEWQKRHTESPAAQKEATGRG